MCGFDVKPRCSHAAACFPEHPASTRWAGGGGGGGDGDGDDAGGDGESSNGDGDEPRAGCAWGRRHVREAGGIYEGGWLRDLFYLDPGARPFASCMSTCEPAGSSALGEAATLCRTRRPSCASIGAGQSTQVAAHPQ